MWKKIFVGDVATFQNGFAFKSKDFIKDGKYKIIKIKELKNGLIKFFDDSASINCEFCNEIKKYAVKDGDILFALTGDPVSKNNPLSWVGRVAIYRHPEISFINQRVCKLIANEKVEPMYIYYYFRVFKNFYTLASKATGSASQANISTKTIENEMIFLPDRETQRKIVFAIQNIDRKIDINESINKNLEEQAQVIFESEFLAFDDSLPVQWTESNLLGIADYLNGLAMQKFRPSNDEIGIPVLKIKELRQGCCDSNSELCSPNIKSEYIVHDGDVIFSWSGSLIVDFWCGDACGLNQHLFKVTSKAYDKWFYFAWTKYHLAKFAALASAMATTMGHIKRGELAKAKVIIPPADEYTRIGSLLQPIYDLIIANRIENRKLATLRDEFLPKLMSGELDVSNLDL